MDDKYLYFKNTSPNYPIIQIPKNRATFYQNHIYKNHHQFTPKVSKDEIAEMFKDALGKNTSFTILDFTYITQDVGFLLKLTKKR